MRHAVVVCLLLAATGCAGRKIKTASLPPDLVSRSDREIAASDTFSNRTLTSSRAAAFSTAPATRREALDWRLSEIYFKTVGYILNVTAKTPQQANLQLEDQSSPDARLAGLRRLTRDPGGRTELYRERYRQLAQLDANPLMRAQALRTLNWTRDGVAPANFQRGLSDQHAAVRLEAVKGLINQPLPETAAALRTMLQNGQEDLDVRIAAADALHHYRDLETARVLASTLTSRDFAIAWQARRSLVLMTGADQRYNEAAWLEYLTGPDKPLG